MKKVYCKDCDHDEKYSAYCPLHKKGDFYSQDGWYTTLQCDKNKNNDCPDFEAKSNWLWRFLKK